MFIDNFILVLADMYYNPKLKSGKITQEQFECLDLKFRETTCNILVSILTFFIGFLLNILPYVIIFFLANNILRVFSSGYHSFGNMTYCFILYTFLSLLFIYVSLITQNFFIIYFLLNIVLFFQVVSKSPYINKNEEEKFSIGDIKNCKLWCSITYIILLLISFIFYKYEFLNFSNIILTSNILVCILMNDFICNLLSKIRIYIYKS